MSRLWLLVLALPAAAFACTEHPAHPSVKQSAKPSLLEFRIVEAEGTDSTVEMPIPGTRESIHVRKIPVIGIAGVAKAVAVPAGSGKANVLVTLKPAAIQTMSQATQVSLGKRLAVLYDGAVLTAPEITGAVVGDKIVVDTSSRTEAETQALVAKVNAATTANN